MSVAGILSSAALSVGAHFFQTRAQHMKQDFQQLGADLQSGNLTAAQADFAALQKFQTQPPTDFSSSSTKGAGTITQDFTQLATDLKAGNTTSAQQDFTKLQQDLQAQSSQLHHRHHHRGGNSDGNTEISQLFTQLGTALQSGDLTAAQKAYSTVLQDFQQSAATGVSSPAGISLRA